MKLKYKEGDKVGYFTILGYSHIDKWRNTWYLTECKCGTVKSVMGSAMTSGNTKSCGCYAKEVYAKKRISNIHSEVTAILLSYKRHAKSRKLEWNLTREEVVKIIGENCNYCNSEPSNIQKTKNSIGDGLFYSGIDRVNSSKGYETENVVPCCKVCNYAKRNMTLENFETWIDNLCNYKNRI